MKVQLQKVYYKREEKIVAAQFTFTSPKVQTVASQSSSQLHPFNIIWTARTPKSKCSE